MPMQVRRVGIVGRTTPKSHPFDPIECTNIINRKSLFDRLIVGDTKNKSSGLLSSGERFFQLKQSQKNLLVHDIQMSCTIDQARRLFASMCFASQNLGTFEKTLNTIPEDDWPIVFLASIIIENCGLKKIQQELATVALQYNDDKKSIRSDYWAPVPNDYILRDRTWLFPVIRACDPGKVVFKEEDYGITLIENLCEKLSINLRTSNTAYSDDPNVPHDVIEVNLSHALRVIAMILSHPSEMGVSNVELVDVLRVVFDGDGFEVLLKQSPISLSSPLSSSKRSEASHTTKTDDCTYEKELNYENTRSSKTNINPVNEELSRGLVLLAILTLSFVATGLVSGYLYKPRSV